MTKTETLCQNRSLKQVRLDIGQSEDRKRTESEANKMRELSEYKTAELATELKRREGVETYEIEPSASRTVNAEGPAIIFVVTD